MASINEVIDQLFSELDGCILVLLGDSESGMSLASAGSGMLDPDAAAAITSEFLRTKRKAFDAHGIAEPLEDMLINMENGYHVIRPLRARPEIFVYAALDRAKANLGMSRLRVQNAEDQISF